ncbi:MAG: phosphonate metabolism protein/1,5-bisphosphokinase (PRPP-forming) PhnN [Desulfobulbaceae bacterium]|nr:MAG: phosphonate metabolism protein/1,5-bisphosphokinase (PRPP-forming) PhnN [Desulfobulbaceae bacterium]
MTMADLFYVIGASGSGKDSLLSYARERVGAEVNLAFAHRYITRPADAGNENHVALSNLEFASRLSRGLMAMHWQSHGLYYGIGIEIDQWLARGVSVVVNGSRGYLPEAAERYSNLRPVLINVPPAVLEERLVRRGRENPEEIAGRLARAASFGQINHPRLVSLDNSGPLNESGERLLELLHHYPCACNY